MPKIPDPFYYVPLVKLTYKDKTAYKLVPTLENIASSLYIGPSDLTNQPEGFISYDSLGLSDEPRYALKVLKMSGKTYPTFSKAPMFRTYDAAFANHPNTYFFDAFIQNEYTIALLTFNEILERPNRKHGGF